MIWTLSVFRGRLFNEHKYILLLVDNALYECGDDPGFHSTSRLAVLSSEICLPDRYPT